MPRRNKETIMESTGFSHPLSRADIVEIERRAHVMRAQAMRELVRGAGRALRSALAALFGRARTA